MNRRGFTLIEIMIAMSVGLLTLLAIYAVTEMAQRSSVAVERKIIAQQDARAALDIMALEIRMASYNPNFATGIWTDGPTGSCGSMSGNQTYKGIQEATTNSITVEMDIDGSSAIGDASNEIIRYNYNTAQQYVSRQTNCGGGASAFLGNTASNQRDVRVVNNLVGIPVFRYYDGTGTEIASGSLPSDIPDIRRIDITLVVETEWIDESLGRRRRIITSTSVIARNHAAEY